MRSSDGKTGIQSLEHSTVLNIARAHNTIVSVGVFDRGNGRGGRFYQGVFVPTSRLKIYFSTVVRSAPQEQGGEIVLLNWESKTIESNKPIVPANPEIYDPNPRGNSRGGRGIELFNNRVVVANYHTLEVYDRNLLHQLNVSHPLMVGLHEICRVTDEQVLISSTAIDAALLVDLGTNNIIKQYWPREMPGLQKALNLIPLDINKQIDNRTLFLDEGNTRRKGHIHLNAVAAWNGETFALFNRIGAIVNLDRDEIVVQDKSLLQPHNLHIDKDGMAVVNNTFKRSVHIYNLHTREMERTINLTSIGLVRRLMIKHDPSYLLKAVLKEAVLHKISAPRPIFVRGLDRYENLLFVGISPATILCLDWKSGALVDSYHYSNDVSVCIHGLKVVAE